MEWTDWIASSSVHWTAPLVRAGLTKPSIPSSIWLNWLPGVAGWSGKRGKQLSSQTIGVGERFFKFYKMNFFNQVWPSDFMWCSWISVEVMSSCQFSTKPLWPVIMKISKNIYRYKQNLDYIIGFRYNITAPTIHVHVNESMVNNHDGIDTWIAHQQKMASYWNSSEVITRMIPYRWFSARLR